MHIVIGTDHAGFEMKQQLVSWLQSAGHTVQDLGTHSTDSVDYPDYARAVAEAVATGQAERGILLCGSGVGVSIAANKVPGVRAATCHDTYAAHQGVEHDDLNVLVLGARIIGIALAQEIVSAFVSARFQEEDRFQRRLNKVLAIEAHYLKTVAEID